MSDNDKTSNDNKNGDYKPNHNIKESNGDLMRALEIEKIQLHMAKMEVLSWWRKVLILEVDIVVGSQVMKHVMHDLLELP